MQDPLPKIVTEPQQPAKPRSTDPEAPEDLTARTVRLAPPWLTSLVFHMLVLLVAGLCYLPQLLVNSIKLEAVYAEKLGDQLIDDSLQMPSLPATDMVDPIFSQDTTPTENPFAAPPDIELNSVGAFSTSKIDAPSIGLAFSGREKGLKEALLAAYGGTATTEAAVARGLEWLKRQQYRDGFWDLDGPYTNGSMESNRVGASAMALLAFQGAGHTHRSGQHQDVVRKGWKALLSLQDRQSGNFFREGPPQHRLYSQALATIAVCELYGMTQDSQYFPYAQRALDYAANTQAPEGGWRYSPGFDTDTSVTGWFMMAFQSGKMAGLEVDEEVLTRVSQWLDLVSNNEAYGYPGSRYAYRQDWEPTPTMTAEGLLCRQYLGWRRSDARMVEGVNYIGRYPIVWSEKNVYYWYYAAQTLRNVGGDAWEDWNRVMRQVIPENQIRAGAEEGSWSPDRDPHGNIGGRLYETCFCIYMLEVYYRHLPLYGFPMK